MYYLSKSVQLFLDGMKVPMKSIKNVSLPWEEVYPTAYE